jgi:hypothetical protein
MLTLMPLGVHMADLVALQHLGAKCPVLKNVVVVDG